MSSKMMTSKIEQLIDEIEDYIDSCKPAFFNNNNIVVNKEEIDEFFTYLKSETGIR